MDVFDIEDIYNNHDYWMIAFCVTPWHVMGVKTFVERKIEENASTVNRKSALIILPHPKTGFCAHKKMVDELNIPTLNLIEFSLTDYNKLVLKDVFRAIIRFKSYKSKESGGGYVLSTLEPFLFCELTHNSLNHKRELVLLDEGVSSYLSLYGYIRHSYIESMSIAGTLKLSIRLVMSKFLKTLCNVEVSEWFLFNKKFNFRVNEDVIMYYKRLYIAQKDININYKYILYLSQPPVSDIEKEVIPELIQCIATVCKSLGAELYVKAHPRDNIDALQLIEGTRILPYSGPVENIFARFANRPLAVIGFRSTALLTLRAFFNVNGISVLGILKNEYHKRENYDEKFFRKTFTSQFSFPKNYAELSHSLNIIINDVV